MNWCESYGSDYEVYAWSDNDYNQLVAEMKLKGYTNQDKMGLLENWFDFQKEYTETLGLERILSLEKALNYAGIEFERRMHDALCDAKNTAELFAIVRNEERCNVVLRAVIDALKPKQVGNKLGDVIDFGALVAQGNKVVLKVINEDEKDKYLAVSYEYSIMKDFYKEEVFRKAIWEELLFENAFVCSIYNKTTEKFVGYCSVKNLMKEDWELAIELMPDECHKGYGTEALKIFVDAVHRLTGKNYFRVRVELDNHVSQGLMKKLGAMPNGISEFLLHEEEITRFQEEHMDMITDEIREVATDFGMEAENMLGYVLEYRLYVEKQ